MQYAFYYDQSRCMGCNTCTVSCKDWNQVEPGPARWRRLKATESGVFPSTAVFNLVQSCHHCANPACMAACPVGAIYKRSEDGIVLVDRVKCQSLRSCAARCPYGGPQFGDDSSEPARDAGWSVAHPMQKCTLCVDRWAIGKKPACVDACPQRALDAGPLDELMAKYPAAQRVVVGFPQTTRDPSGNLLDRDTMPSILFKPKS